MRKPQITIESEKVKVLIEMLNPITDWSNIQKGSLIFNINDNNIFNSNLFIKYDKENNIVHYKVYNQEIKSYKEYQMSATNWYYYDESIADEVEYEFKPKLWWSHNKSHVENFWICVTNSIEELYQRYAKEKGYKGSFQDWEQEYCYGLISEVDDYTVELH